MILWGLSQDQKDCPTSENLSMWTNQINKLKEKSQLMQKKHLEKFNTVIIIGENP